MTSFDSPLYLHLDSKTDTYPNNHPKRNNTRTHRRTRFSFETYDCNYFVDVIVIYANDPQAVNHEVRIRIEDWNGEGDTLKQVNFIPNDGRACSIEDARRLADLHLSMALSQ